MFIFFFIETSYSVTMHAAYYQYVQNYTEQSADTAAVGQLLREDRVYADQLENLSRLTEKREEDAPAFDVPNPELMEQYLGDTIQLSASALERYQKCPFQYYCQDILRLYQRQKMQMTGANNGSMVHYCLEQILRNYDKESFLALLPGQLQKEIETLAAAYWQENMGGDFSKSGREQAIYRHAVSNVLPVLLHLQAEFRQSAFAPYCTELQISPKNPDFPPICLKTSHGQTVRLIGKVDRVDLCQDGDKQWVRIVDYKTGKKEFSLGNLLFGLDMQMLIYLFSILSPGTALAGASPAGVLYLPAGKVRSDQERGSAAPPEKAENDAYKMNGVLLRDTHLLQLMEEEGEGIYIPGKVDGNGQLDTKRQKGEFLTEEQMHSLRGYVLDQLKAMAERVYRGEIDALPLQFSDNDPCIFCAFANICGNSELCRKKPLFGNKKQWEKKMFEILENAEKEEND